jgi:hypothetical protein
MKFLKSRMNLAVPYVFVVRGLWCSKRVSSPMDGGTPRSMTTLRARHALKGISHRGRSRPKRKCVPKTSPREEPPGSRGMDEGIASPLWKVSPKGCAPRERCC